MRRLMAILVAVVVMAPAAPVTALAAPAPMLASADAAGSADQPAQREQPSPTTDASQSGPEAEGNASAAWGSALWILIMVVAAAAFIGLAMIALRGSQRRTGT